MDKPNIAVKDPADIQILHNTRSSRCQRNVQHSRSVAPVFFWSKANARSQNCSQNLLASSPSLSPRSEGESWSVSKSRLDFRSFPELAVISCETINAFSLSQSLQFVKPSCLIKFLNSACFTWIALDSTFHLPIPLSSPFGCSLLVLRNQLEMLPVTDRLSRFSLITSASASATLKRPIIFLQLIMLISMQSLHRVLASASIGEPWCRIRVPEKRLTVCKLGKERSVASANSNASRVHDNPAKCSDEASGLEPEGGLEDAHRISPTCIIMPASAHTEAGVRVAASSPVGGVGG